LLPGSLAGLAALRGRTKLLTASIPVIGDEQLFTVQTFTATRFGLHQIGAASNRSSASRQQAGRKSEAEEDGERREEEILSVNGEEDGTGRRPQFQIARFTPYSDRR
jgi:hypothetical protein